MTRPADDLAQLKADLQDNAESLLLALFGEPSSRTRREWRWGSHGSKSYRFDRGTFYDFEIEDGGSLFDAIRIDNGSNIGAAITWARQWLGEDPAQRPAPKPRRKPTHNTGDDRQIDLAEARALWPAGRGIHGTAAARYLQGRAITGWPADCVRFIAAKDVARISSSPDRNGEGRKPWSWWRHPAIMFPATNAAGDVGAVQIIALTDQGAAITDDDGKKLKRTRGIKDGCALRLPGDVSGPLVLAEGAETALSIWLAIGYETWAMLGSWRLAPLDAVPLDRAIVIARDDDPRTKKTANVRMRQAETIAGWRAAGRHVVEAQPWLLSRGDKSDFNDALQDDGPDAVRDRIDRALRPQPVTQGIPRSTALVQLSSAVGKNVAECLAWQGDGETVPPFNVIRSTAGLGKSQAALAAFVDALKGLSGPFALAAPTHELAAELAERLTTMAADRGVPITVRVWHGRDRKDPVSGEPMCRDIIAADLARHAGVNVTKTVCDAPCQFREGCSYIAQRSARADVWVVPHALLFTALPEAIKGVKLLVIDESIALAGLMGTDGAPVLVALDTLGEYVTHGNGQGAASEDLNAILLPFGRLLQAAVADHDTGGPMRKKPTRDADQMATVGAPIKSAALIAAGISADMIDEARKAHGKRRRDVSRLAGATRETLLRELGLVSANNSAASKAALLCRHLADLLTAGAEASGRVELVTMGDGSRAFRLFGLKAMGKGWRELPILNLDATADLALLQLRIPQAQIVEDVTAAEPYVSVYQLTGSTFGKTSLKSKATRDAVRRFTMLKAMELGGEWMLGADKDAITAWSDPSLPAGEALPSNIGTAYWGNVRGLDKFRNVRGAVIVGRWGASPDAVSRVAGILSGNALAPVEGWYSTEAVTLTAADGSVRTVDADRHPDPLGERVRRAMVDCELLQMTARPRGVQRHAGEPLALFILGNAVTSLPLASVGDWQAPDTGLAMLADHGVWLQSAGDAATVTGETLIAVKRQRDRARMVPAPNKIFLLVAGTNLPEWLATVTYQRQGPGRSETRMVYSPDRISDPQAWLVARFGPLAHFELDQAEAPAEPVRNGTIDLPAVTASFTHAQLDQARLPDVGIPISDPAPVAGNPISAPDRGAITVGLDVPIGTDLSTAFTISATATWPDAQADNIGPAWGDYDGGIMPVALARFVRRYWPRAGITQQQLADRASISRPQLANALLGRFGLSKDAAERLRLALAALPASSQASLSL